MGRFLAVLGALLLGVIAALSPSLATDFGKPGSLPVGQQSFTIPGDQGGHPLRVAIWYPAAVPSPTESTLWGTKDAAPASTGPFPLIVLIHGLSGRGSVYSAWGVHLASYGFVVAAADYDDGLTGPLDAGVKLEDRVADWLLYARPANVVRVVAYADALTASGGKLAGVIDTHQIGVWGHSTGGSTALQAAGARIDLEELDKWCAANPEEKWGESCQFVGHEQPVAALYGADPLGGPLPPVWDKRVDALALAAPGGELHVFGDTGIAAVKVPTLIMVGNADASVDPSTNALWAYDAISSKDKSLAVFDKGGHSLFLRLGDAQFEEAEALTTAFFLDILKGDSTGHAARLAGPVAIPWLAYKATLH